MLAMPEPRETRRRRETAMLIPYETDRTDALRTLYPQLSNVWDELDELRADAETYEARLADVEGDRDGLSDTCDTAAKDLRRAINDYDMSADLQSLLDDIADDLS